MHTHRLAGCAILLLAIIVLPVAVRAEAQKPWNTKVNLSYLRSTGNSDNETFAGSAEFTADYSPQRVLAKAGHLTSQNNGDLTAERTTAEARYEYLLTERMFGFVAADYLRDPFSGYDSRIRGGPGVGYDLIRTDAHQLKGLASLQYTYSNFSDDGSESYVSGKAAGEYVWKISEQATFQQLLDYQVSLEDTNVFFINSDSKIEYNLNTHLAVAAQYLLSYQNDPPGGADDLDRTLLASLVLKY